MCPHFRGVLREGSHAIGKEQTLSPGLGRKDNVESVLERSVLRWNRLPCLPAHYHCILLGYRKSKTTPLRLLNTEVRGKANMQISNGLLTSIAITYRPI